MLFNRQRFLGIRTGIFLLLSIALMTVDHHYKSASSLRSLLTLVVTPVQYLITGPIEFVRLVDQTLTTNRTLKRENQSLKAQNLFLQAKVQKINTLYQENTELRALLNTPNPLNVNKYLAADIVSVDLAPFIHQVVINKGQDDGVYTGQPVVDATGVMGQIVSVSKHSSKLMLVTDATCAIPVQSLRVGERAIASGQGDSPNLTLLYVPNTADFKRGDILVTSGLDEQYLTGYPVGEVISVSHKIGERFTQVIVRPLAKLNRSRHVLLVWPERDENKSLRIGPKEPVKLEEIKG